VMGDNRGNSDDSRNFGPVPVDTVVGRGFLLIWPPKDFSTL
jgi:signal peptidase I